MTHLIIIILSKGETMRFVLTDFTSNLLHCTWLHVLALKITYVCIYSFIVFKVIEVLADIYNNFYYISSFDDLIFLKLLLYQIVIIIFFFLQKKSYKINYGKATLEM